MAVHGLNGHRERTWTAENGVLWLRDLLPPQVPNVRIITYGYDSRTHSREKLTHATLYEQATSFVSNLYVFRERTNTLRRPIIFVAHSLGGILVKSALLHSELARKDHLEYLKSVKLSTHGILFFGTPHRGGDGVPLGKILLKLLSVSMSTNDKVLKHIDKYSEFLSMQLSQFTSISNDFEIKCFYETYPTPLPIGTSVIVPTHSAVIQGVPDAEAIGIKKNHRAMVRYEASTDDDFQTVSTHILFMCRTAWRHVRTNWDSWKRIQGMESDRKPHFKVSFNLPHRRNRNFTGRKSFLENIHSQLSQEENSQRSSTVAIYGIGGVGKTQVALEYAYQCSKDYSSVLWINAQSLQSVQRSFADIAQRLVGQLGITSEEVSPDYLQIARSLDLVGLVDNNGQLRVAHSVLPRADPDSHPETTNGGAEQITVAVHQWLSREGNDEWLLILDNLDSLETVDISNVLPQDPHGKILITSRRPESARLGHGVPLMHMGKEEALMLFSRSLSRIFEEEDPEYSEASKIVERVGYLPLAIDQAGAYLNKLSKPTTAYLPLYERNKKALLSKKPPAATWCWMIEASLGCVHLRNSLHKIQGSFSPMTVCHTTFVA